METIISCWQEASRQNSHSLGILIEWKQHKPFKEAGLSLEIPTRWGY